MCIHVHAREASSRMHSACTLLRVSRRPRGRAIAMKPNVLSDELVEPHALIIIYYCKNKKVVLTHSGLTQLQLQLSGLHYVLWNVCTFAVFNQLSLICCQLA